jgi:hypothetical protein
MAQLLAGIMPVKTEVDIIIRAARRLVQLGTVTGVEQPVGAIIAAATSILPMAAQSMLQPGAGAGPGPGIPPVGAGPMGGAPNGR